MRSPNNVLMGIALFLLAGVILYNVFMTDETVTAEIVTELVTETTTVATTIESTTDNEFELIKININTATEEELETLTGIGPAKAAAIVEYRERNGSFSSVEELTNVSGIGEKTLAKIIDEITV